MGRLYDSLRGCVKEEELKAAQVSLDEAIAAQQAQQTQLEQQEAQLVAVHLVCIAFEAALDRQAGLDPQPGEGRR